ncbi:hypothetical protein PHLCEN_2v13711 [Hermanssonia centrifuga]|uniref:Uncharacterized protein n=1 Tax=Hermanssonia centrifuga TaxID=98765 RepID=A0A2R6NDM2_9APHY|nr:hypothetical protein PHLCEN_2v13711 [Hermanssonia centrifuga]
MTNHFWLVWYRAQSPMGPKHWSLFVTYDTDEQALGTIYQVEGNGWGTGQFTSKTCRGVQLKGARGSQAYENRLYLGEIRDGVNGMMQEYCDAATEMINEHNISKTDVSSREGRSSGQMLAQDDEQARGTFSFGSSWTIIDVTI